MGLAVDAEDEFGVPFMFYNPHFICSVPVKSGLDLHGRITSPLMVKKQKHGANKSRVL